MCVFLLSLNAFAFTPKPGGFYPKRVKRIEIFHRSKIFNLLYRWRCRHSKTSFKCVTPVRNYDGDTITVNIDRVHPIIGDEISIRVIGIDTAEIRTSDQCEKDMAYKAKDFVEKEIMGARRINLNKISRDKYFRIAADVIIDGVSLSKKLIDEGLAYPYDGGTKPDVNWCNPLDEQFDMTSDL